MHCFTNWTQVYPEYLALSDEEVPVEYQPYAAADSPTALSPGYIADSDPEEDPEDESEDGPTDYPADKGDDDDDDASGDDVDDEDEEEASKEDEDEEEEEEHLAPADSTAAASPVRLTRLLAITLLQLPITTHASNPPTTTDSLTTTTVSSPPLPLPSPLTTSPTDARAPLGYRASRIRLRNAS
ncbi:hypothetical protein Tco_0695685 [Tanacetum coccineum]